MKPNVKKILGIGAGAAVFAFAVATLVSVVAVTNPADPTSLNEYEKVVFESTMNGLYPERKDYVHPLPYSLTGANLKTASGSAIIIDYETGSILYEKNADDEIPPASMTKLVEMYVVFEEVASGRITLDDTVPLPPESWAKNLPSDASVMFLGEGQHVTLRELLLGLSIASGNDASIAVAKYVAGSMDDFVAKMNEVIRKMGLKKTHFVESSGYSEKNITTAKEFAAFCRNYVRKFPFALEDFHAQPKLAYPLGKNQSDSMKHVGDTQAVIQLNTNKLLTSLEGCDGLKTGFIYESGYNISVTAKRGGRRFISITMKGPGTGSKQGNHYRVADNTEMMEFAFSSFVPYKPSNSHEFKIGVSSFPFSPVRLVPALDESFSVPMFSGLTEDNVNERMNVRAEIPSNIENARAGQQVGQLVYELNGKVLRIIPLVADRNSPAQTAISRMWGKYIGSIITAAKKR